MLTLHPVAGEVKSPEDAEKGDKRLKQLLFLDLLDEGIYIAERGFMALSLMVTDRGLQQAGGGGGALHRTAARFAGGVRRKTSQSTHASCTS